MAVISHTYRYLFVQAPRTGCTAIAEGVLRPALQGVDIPPHDVYDDAGRLVIMRKHCKLSDLLQHGYLTVGEAENLLKFSAIRNPYDSLVSLYVKMRDDYPPALTDPSSWMSRDPVFAAAIRFAAEHSFSEWVEYRYGERTHKRVARAILKRGGGGGHDQGMDVVMRFERLQDDFNAVLQRIGLPEIEIPRVNSTQGRDGDYRSYYTPRARKTVTRVFRDTLDRYGYTF